MSLSETREAAEGFLFPVHSSHLLSEHYQHRSPKT